MSVENIENGDVLVTWNGETVKVTKTQNEALVRAGTSSALILTLLQLFGPVLVKLLLRIIERRFGPDVSDEKLKLDFSFFNPKAVLVNLLKEYKDAIGDLAEQGVEGGIDALIKILGG